jgi:hypothetical protein
MNTPTSITEKLTPEAMPREQRALPLALTVRDDPAELSALWAMSKQQRIDAMWAGQLTLSQLCDWSARRPSEVPRLGTEFAWHVMRTPEWAEAEEPNHNVLPMPRRDGQRLAA